MTDEKKREGLLMSKARNRSPFLGRWRITEMSECDQDYMDMENKAFIEFEQDGAGQFQFGLVQGIIDYRLVERGGGPAIDWTWEGSDECDPVMGRGWATLESDRTLRGYLFIHHGDDSTFRAEKSATAHPTHSRKTRSRGRTVAPKRREGRGRK